MLIELTCQRYGKIFKVVYSLAHRRNSSKKYCSRECYLAPTIQERFWAKVVKTSECWLWTGAKNSTDYGHFRWIDGRTHYSHRISYELTHGPILDGMNVLHHCDNPSCVNPSHLFLGTDRDNKMDSVNKKRHHTKLNDDIVRMIRASGEPQTILAARYSISTTVISRVRNRLAWRHVF